MEKPFYEKCINILRQREIYNQIVWKESFRHLDMQAMREYLDE